MSTSEIFAYGAEPYTKLNEGKTGSMVEVYGHPYKTSLAIWMDGVVTLLQLELRYKAVIDLKANLRTAHQNLTKLLPFLAIADTALVVNYIF